ncbi:MAG: prolyl oligopeptidase family serine peptidase [Candidatus Cloacimonetes bacterium]|nr:prolyl oligopeptidase family serine peptidase [Candidatus Cloacimonadota bacterium]
MKIMLKLKPYPDTTKIDVVDDYFGTKVKDPFRWLEEDQSSETEKWVKSQNEITEDFLSQIPFREKIRERLTEIWNYERYSSPSKNGEYFYYFKNDGLQDQSILYRTFGLAGNPEIFLDPNTLSEDGTVALSDIYFSNDNRYMAYSINRSGSDWTEIFVKDTETEEVLKDHIKWVKFFGISWYGKGFYYSRFDELKENEKLSGQNQFMKIYFHKLGSPQEEDILFYEDKENPHLDFCISVTEDEKYLILSVFKGTSGNELYYHPATEITEYKQNFIPIIQGFDYNSYVIDHYNDNFLILTDKDAPNNRLISVSVNPDYQQKWKDIIPERDHPLGNISTGGGKLFAFYLKDVSTKILQYNYNGKLEKEIPLPALGSAYGLNGKREDKTLFYSFMSFTTPATIYRYDIESGEFALFRKPELRFNPDDYEIKQVFYKSKDLTSIPMFIVHKKAIVLNGKNPTYLYGYGGFNASSSPYFSNSMMIFLENGGIYAEPSIRGGGEYGEDWHKAGMLEKKQNVFDDFIAAAEYLILENYTSSEKFVIVGSSNGGLLVGAVMTQRPDLFRVALPDVGVLDMLRYHKFTIGYAWVVEYGSSDNEKDFEYLIKYSPLHNIKKDVSYPATLITTADHDDRVVPAHSFKFTATLQELNKDNGINPILIRIETNAGHGAGTPLSKIISEVTDKWSFVFYHLDIGCRIFDFPCHSEHPLKP